MPDTHCHRVECFPASGRCGLSLDHVRLGQSQRVGVGYAQAERTRNASKELPGKALDLTVRKRHKRVPFQEVENALPQQVHDYADVTSVVKAVTKMYAPISVFVVICFEGCKDPQLYS